MENEKIKELLKELETAFDNVITKQELEVLKQDYVGKNGKITMLSSLIKEVEDKKAFGMKLNEVKNKFNDLYTKTKLVPKSDMNRNAKTNTLPKYPK